MGEERVLFNCTWKLARAQKHIDEPGKVLESIWKTTPAAFITGSNEHGYHQYEVGGGLPWHVPVIIVAHNLRSALDHAYFQLVLSHQQPVSKGMQFPFHDTREKLEEFLLKPKRSQKEGCVPGQEVIELLLDDIKPFPGSMLWRLHQLNVEDKHKMLTTIAAFATIGELKIGTKPLLEHDYAGTAGSIHDRFSRRA